MIARKTSLRKSKSSLKRKRFSVSSATGEKKRGLNKADFLREWGLPYPAFQWSSLRYKTPPEKGVYWYYISLEVRNRDVKKYGTCISCGREITVDTCDAGHFIPASSCGRDLLFDLINVHAECCRCNAWDEGHLFGYERGLIKRYGKEAPLALKDRYFLYKTGDRQMDWKGHEYAEKIKALSSYQQRMIELSKDVI
jgi:hypothetical protein